MSLGIRNRLLVSSTLVLATGLGLTGWLLDRSFDASLETGAREQLKLVVYGLIGVAEEHDAGLEFPTEPLEPRLAQPGSGLYARVWSSRGDLVWESPSLRLAAVETNALPALPSDLQPGRFRFRTDARHYVAYYPVIWESAGEQTFILSVAVDRAPFRAESREFRRTWIAGLIAVVVLLMLVQALGIALGLRPVAVMAARVEEVESGARREMGDDYPRELDGLARNLDRFIEHEAASRDRYRKAMEDLAHSLKTPLAVLKNALRGRRASGEDALLAEQLDRMENAVAYQLSRAIAARPALHAPQVPLAGLVDRLVRALEKAHPDKMHCQNTVAATTVVRCDERDLMEMLGNVLENAFKYGRSQVRVGAEGESGWVAIAIEDDGPGIPAALRTAVLARGARADTRVDGHGIGLSVVVELATAYGGALDIEDSDLGGAKVLLRLPGNW